MAGVSAAVTSRTALATASQPGTPLNFDVPPNATDCAVHVYEPARFPYWEGRSYTPEPASLDELRQVLRTLKLERVVVVQATSYGTDNACVVASLRALGARARGVAIIDEKTPESSFDEMHKAGVRSVRPTLNNLAASDPAAARQRLNMTVDRLKARNWSLQLSTNTVTYEILRDELMALPVTLVVDHFGQVQAADGVGQRGFATILALLKSGKAFVKISNPNSISKQPDLSDVGPVREGPRRRQPAASRLGFGMATSDRRRRTQADRSLTSSADRRWTQHEHAPRVGAGRSHAENDSGG